MPTLNHLSLDPIAQRFPQDRLYVFAGRGSVGIIPDTVMGIGPFYFPPISGKEFELSYRLMMPDLGQGIGDSGRKEHYAPPQIMLQQIDWQPWRLLRRGIYHRRVGDQTVYLEVQSELTAPADADGVVMSLTLTLHSPARLRLSIQQEIRNPDRAFGRCADDAWNYEIPSAQGIIWPQGPCVWRTDGCQMNFLADPDLQPADRGWQMTLRSGAPRTIHLGFTLKGDGLMTLSKSPASHARSAHTYWTHLYQRMTRLVGERVGSLAADRRQLFLRAWATGMTCRWDRANFYAQPYYAAEGIDGGSICSYLWDFSYASEFLSQLEGRALRPLIQRYIDPRFFFDAYSLSPIGGHWLGVFYAFNPYALVRNVSDYVRVTDDRRWLAEPLRHLGRTSAIEAIESIVTTFDRRYRSNRGVLDFDHNRHLIELLTAGYEGLVPNPNFEHAWSLMEINRLRQAAGLKPRPAYARRAKALLQACERLFWNRRQGWYFPAAQRDRAGIWSIQILSALRLGLFPREHVQAMVRHLRDGRFLGPAGVYSIARDDHAHFTLNDVDWGGGGCFTGHVGILLEGLARYGLTEPMNDILDRIAWWGTQLPYIPQSARADAQAAFQDRPNAVAAAAICQALLTSPDPELKSSHCMVYSESRLRS